MNLGIYAPSSAGGTRLLAEGLCWATEPLSLCRPQPRSAGRVVYRPPPRQEFNFLGNTSSGGRGGQKQTAVAPVKSRLSCVLESFPAFKTSRPAGKIQETMGMHQ